MVDRSQKVHQLGFKCVRIFTHLFEWKFTMVDLAGSRTLG